MIPVGEVLPDIPETKAQIPNRISPLFRHVLKFAPLLFLLPNTACDSEATAIDNSTVSTAPNTATTAPSTTNSEPSTTPVVESTVPLLVNREDVANCKLFSGNDGLQYADAVEAPTNPPLQFFGDCEGHGQLWFWGYQGKESDLYTVHPDPSTKFKYNSKGYAYGEMPADGAGIPTNAEHPAYREFGALTLAELEALDPGTTICYHQGLSKASDFNLEVEYVGVGLGAHYDPKYMAEPFYFPYVKIRHPSGAPQNPMAAAIGIVPVPGSGAWTINYTTIGSCAK